MQLNVQLPEDSLIISRDEIKKIIEEVHQQDEIMTVKECAGFLKVSIPTLRNFLEETDIPFFKRGQIIRFSKNDVMVWMKQ